MIELTPEQWQAVSQGESVRVTDPTTHDTYVVVRAEVFEELTGPSPRRTHEPTEGINPWLLPSMQAFWRDLPELLKLKSRKRQYVAYHGDERVTFGRDHVEVYQECFRRGLQRGEFYVAKIETDPEGIPPWGTWEGDRSLYEFVDVGEDGELPPDNA